MSSKLLLALIVWLAVGCATQPWPEKPAGRVETQQAAHPRYAPPPVVSSHWRPALGVYVVEGVRDVYYRERVFYHWDVRWFWSTQAAGPWQAAENTAVPPGLLRHYKGR